MSDEKDVELDQSEALADHLATLEYADKALTEALVQIRKIRTDYAKAEKQRSERITADYGRAEKQRAGRPKP